jgi:hypothetical protein
MCASVLLCCFVVYSLLCETLLIVVFYLCVSYNGVMMDVIVVVAYRRDRFELYAERVLWHSVRHLGPQLCHDRVVRVFHALRCFILRVLCGKIAS